MRYVTISFISVKGKTYKEKYFDFGSRSISDVTREYKLLVEFIQQLNLPLTLESDIEICLGIEEIKKLSHFLKGIIKKLIINKKEVPPGSDFAELVFGRSIYLHPKDFSGDVYVLSLLGIYNYCQKSIEQNSNLFLLFSSKI